MASTKKELKGVLEGWSETGTEGMVWSFHEDGKAGYNGLNILDAGDYLVVYDKDNKVVFQGKINPDYKIGRKRRPGTNYWQPVALGMWVHWIQKGWQPDDWAKLFFNEPPLRAVLRKK